MKIEEVIQESVVAVFADPDLAELLVLKGGSALRILEGRDDRLSIDLDFSIADKLKKADEFFKKIEKALTDRYQQFDLDLIDFKYVPKPSRRGKNQPDWWGGWRCEFKLASAMHRYADHAIRQRNAMIPEGSNSTKIEIEISECEYCGSTQQKKVGGVQVQGYSKSALVVEKLRAICQQHPNYVVPHTTKNRARDFVDIYSLMQGYSEDFFEQCAAVLEPIFTAKHVPIKLLEKILSDDAFVESQRLGFAQVKATIKGRTYEFETYLEFVRAFVVRLLKSIKI